MLLFSSRSEPHPHKRAFLFCFYNLGLIFMVFSVIATGYHNNFIEKYEEGVNPLDTTLQLSAQDNHIKDMAGLGF